MKKFIVSSFILFQFFSCSKKGCTDPISQNYDSSAVTDDGSCLISVPDDNFELYLESHNPELDSVNIGDLNSMGDGINNNNLVLLDRIKSVDSLVLRYQSASNPNVWNSIGINDLTGIEGFKDLEYFDCAFNPISSADFSGNPKLNFLWLQSCSNLSSIDIQSNLLLDYLDVWSGNLSNLDISNNTALRQLNCGNNKLNTLNISNNINLEVLECHFNNQLNSLDLTSNINLRSLNCNNSSNLSSIDLRNGANNLMNIMLIHNTPNLSCISVDDSIYSNNNWNGLWYQLDPQHYFSNSCP